MRLFSAQTTFMLVAEAVVVITGAVVIFIAISKVAAVLHNITTALGG